RETLESRAGKDGKGEFKALETPLDALHKEFRRLEAEVSRRPDGELTRREVMDLHARASEVEVKFNEAKLRQLLRRHSDLIASMGVKDAGQVAAMSRLSSELTGVLDQMGSN